MVEWPAGRAKPAIVLATVGEARRATLARRVRDLEVLRAGNVREATGWLRERDAVDAVIVDVELSEDQGTQVIVSGKAHGLSPIIALARDVRSLAARYAACLGARIYPREDSALALRDLVVPWRIQAHVPAGLEAIADSVALAHGLTRTQRERDESFIPSDDEVQSSSPSSARSARSLARPAARLLRTKSSRPRTGTGKGSSASAISSRRGQASGRGPGDTGLDVDPVGRNADLEHGVVTDHLGAVQIEGGRPESSERIQHARRVLLAGGPRCGCPRWPEALRAPPARAPRRRGTQVRPRTTRTTCRGSRDSRNPGSLNAQACRVNGQTIATP